MEMTSLAREDPTTLFRAASEGRVDTLNSLILRDPLILHKASLTSMSETPLHVSSLKGHLHFTRAILNRHPKMASELDTSKRSPLHLASAEVHAEIVEALLRVDGGICLGHDEDGRIPLHLAAMRGRTEVIKNLINAKPDSINLLLDGETALHLCVRYNHLDALKIFVEMIDDDDELINKGNKDGNTILHLATLLQHVEILEYLISLPKVRASTAVTVNKLGFTALEVSEHGPGDLKIMKIRRILMGASPVTKTPTDNDELGQQRSPTISSERTMKRWFKKLMHGLDYQGNWLEDMRGSLMIVATVIATISFQVATNPPGGVLQANYTDDHNLNYLSIFLDCNAKYNQNQRKVCQLPGKAVLGYVYESKYYQLVIYNSLAFIASLSIILLIITGFPLRSKLFMWFLTLTMGTAVTSLAVTYLLSFQMVSPFDVFSGGDYFEDYDHAHKLQWRAALFWLGLLILVGGINSIRFLYWVGKKLNQLLHKMLSKFRTKRREGIANSPRREHRISPGV